MGTGPGEVWVGPEEIKVAYEHFFEGFDKGEQNFQYHFKIGGVSTDMGWLMASGNITGKKNGKAVAFPLNISLTVAKAFRPLADRGNAFFNPHGRRRGVSQRKRIDESNPPRL